MPSGAFITGTAAAIDLGATDCTYRPFEGPSLCRLESYAHGLELLGTNLDHVPGHLAAAVLIGWRRCGTTVSGGPLAGRRTGFGDGLFLLGIAGGPPGPHRFRENHCRDDYYDNRSQNYENAENDVRAAVAALDNAVLTARAALAAALASQVDLEVARQARIDMELVAPAVPSTFPDSAGGPVVYAVSHRHVAEGQFVREGDPVVDLVIDRPLRLQANVPERYAATIAGGQTAVVTVAFAGFDSVAVNCSGGAGSKSASPTTVSVIVAVACAAANISVPLAASGAAR